MKVLTVKEKGVTKIKVLEDVRQPSEEDEILSALALAKKGDCEISFYDARVLSERLLCKLAHLIHQGQSIQIQAFTRFLRSYLYRLEFPLKSTVQIVKKSPPSDFQAIALGGSAYSLDKLMAIIAALPQTKCAVFIVQHVSDDRINLLDQLLQQKTQMKVLMPQHLMPVEAGPIYVAPPAKHMKVSNGLVYLTADPPVQYARPAIGQLFESLAYEYGPRLIAVLVCGYGSDGVDELKLLKEKGATILIEDSADCEAKPLVEAALQSGNFNHKMKIEGLCCYLAAAAAERDGETDPQLKTLLLEAINTQYGHDFRGYHRGTVDRRLRNLKTNLGRTNFFDMQNDILNSPDIYENFFLDFFIPVSGFFRHPEQFALLRDKILPFLSSFPKIKIWSAGSAGGEEPYSLAILLEEMGLLHKTEIYATDASPLQLKIAKNGLFPQDEVEAGAKRYREAGGTGNWGDYFIPKNGFSSIHPRFREAVNFSRHSLSQEGQFAEFQLILCRNVIIYFTPLLQKKVITLLAASLHRDGFLVIGKKEGLAVAESEHLFTPESQSLKIYHWKEEQRTHA